MERTILYSGAVDRYALEEKDDGRIVVMWDRVGEDVRELMPDDRIALAGDPLYSFKAADLVRWWRDSPLRQPWEVSLAANYLGQNGGRR